MPARRGGGTLSTPRRRCIRRVSRSRAMATFFLVRFRVSRVARIVCSPKPREEHLHGIGEAR